LTPQLTGRHVDRATKLRAAGLDEESFDVMRERFST
jgi:hypothetical protein